LDSEVDFTLKDYAGNVLVGYTIESQRYFTGTGVYLTVSSVTTDYAGRAVTYLDTSADSYRIIVRDTAGVIVKTIDSLVLSSSLLIGTGVYGIPITIGAQSNIVYNAPATVSATCTYNNVTETMTCVVTDISNANIGSRLTMANLSSGSPAIVCNANTSSPSATLTCTILGSNTGVFSYLVEVFYPDGSIYIAASGIIDNVSTTFDWGVNGFFAFIGILLIFAAIGAWNFRVMLFFIGVALFFAKLVNVFNVGWEGLIGAEVLIVIIMTRDS
jgi:hypothetical protein